MAAQNWVRSLGIHVLVCHVQYSQVNNTQAEQCEITHICSATAGSTGYHCECSEITSFLDKKGSKCTCMRLIFLLSSSTPDNPRNFYGPVVKKKATSRYNSKQQRTENHSAHWANVFLPPTGLCKCLHVCKQVSALPLIPPYASSWSVKHCGLMHICLICAGRLMYCGFSWAYEENSMWLDIVTKVYQAISYLKMVKKIKNQFKGGGLWTEIKE